MAVQYLTGDLFANMHKAQALAHGCNCKGSMGKGIATGFVIATRHVRGVSPSLQG